MSSFLEKLKPVDIVSDETVKSQFVKTYMSIHWVSEEEANAFYLKESIYLKQVILDEKNGIAQCTNISIYSSFMESAILGLSAQPCPRAEAYYSKKSANKGNDKAPNWVSICNFVVQAHGELSLRQRAGQIKHAFNPIVVYEGDIFQPETNTMGELIVTYKPSIPRKSNKIIACYIRLALPSGLFDYKWLTIEDIERLKKSSAKFLKNEKGNNLYSSGEDGQIDSSFLETKVIKHAFKSYPKLKISSSAVFEEEIASEQEETFSQPVVLEKQNESTESKVDDNGVF